MPVPPVFRHALAALLACCTLQAAHAANAGTETITTPGDHSFSFQHGGHGRKYLVHVPAQLNLAQPAPVLLALHGGGGDMKFMADDARYGLISKADSAGFIVVFPSGYSRFPGGRLATWNAGDCCAEARDKQIDDVGFIRAVVARLQQQLNVDPKRIYATGMSNGGMMAHRLACEAADVFAGIAAVAGTDNTRQCVPSRPIPVLMIHARNDTHVLFEGGAGADAFRDTSKVTAFASMPETLRRWTQRNACTAAPMVVLDRPGARCERTAGCSGGVTVQACITETGGHSWPGTDKHRRGKEAPSQALSANDVMWDFFSGR